MKKSGRVQQAEELFGTLPSGTSRFVAAAFDDLDRAIDTSRDLEGRGFAGDQLSMFMAAETRERYIHTHPRYKELEKKAVIVEEVELEKARKTMEGAGTGGAIGGALGAAGAAILAVGTTLLVPILGIVVAGPLAAALAGAGAGAAAGGVVGALVGTGMTEYRAKEFEALAKKGHILVGVVAATDAERTTAAEVLQSHGGELMGQAVLEED